MDLILETLQQSIKKTGAKKILLALSGGIDSCVLLHALLQLKKKMNDLNIRVIHVHHGLQKQADQWQMFCQQLCDTSNVEFLCERVVVARKGGESLEACAREVRYAVFAKYLQPQEFLCLAQHKNDQVETLLLQLMRGAGLKGLACMPHIRGFEVGFIFRPMLDITRADIKQYAKYHELSWCEDPSNNDVALLRNAVRHELLPLLEKLNGGVVNNAFRSIQHLQESYRLIDELISIDLKKCCVLPSQLCLECLQQFSLRRQKAILRAWLSQNNVRMPSERVLDNVMDQVVGAKQDANPSICIDNKCLRRFAKTLYLLSPQCALPNDWQDVWDLRQPLILPAGLGTLVAEKIMGGDIPLTILSLDVRFRRFGEVLRLAGCLHHTSLKKLFQQWRVPPWERQQIPLLFCGDVLVMVPGYAVSADIKVAEDEMAWKITWKKNPA